MVRSISRNRIVRTIFTKLAIFYDVLEPALISKQGAQWRSHAIDISGLVKPHRILDACSGTGIQSIQLARHFGSPTHVVAVDFCPAMVTLAKQKIRSDHLHRRIECKTENVEIMPFPDEFFDAVFISFGMRFVSDIRTVLKECRRVLKKDAPMIILELAVPVNPFWRLLTIVQREYWLPFWGWWKARIPSSMLHHLNDSLIHYPDADKLGRMLIRAGYDEVEYEELSGGTFTLHRAIKPGGEE
ncbi:class I SAM-dependent methyltransferase [bacterium]|nr:class I SAM-dependent methyltransferase [bacterium]